MKSRECTMCGEVKPLNQFYKKSTASLGVGSRCKKCDREYQKQRREDEKAEMERLRELENLPELTVFVTGCDGCMFYDDCNHLVWDRHADPYCFVSNPYHANFIRYARNRADTRMRA